MHKTDKMLFFLFIHSFRGKQLYILFPAAGSDWTRATAVVDCIPYYISINIKIWLKHVYLSLLSLLQGVFAILLWYRSDFKPSVTFKIVVY
jgi:hypothetical protein